MRWTSDGREGRQGGWTYRLVGDDGWQLQERTPKRRTQLYTMILEPADPVDVVMPKVSARSRVLEPNRG